MNNRFIFWHMLSRRNALGVVCKVMFKTNQGRDCSYSISNKKIQVSRHGVMKKNTILRDLPAQIVRFLGSPKISNDYPPKRATNLAIRRFA